MLQGLGGAAGRFMLWIPCLLFSAAQSPSAGRRWLLVCGFTSKWWSSPQSSQSFYVWDHPSPAPRYLRCRGCTVFSFFPLSDDCSLNIPAGGRANGAAWSLGWFQALRKAVSPLENLRRGEGPGPRRLVARRTWPQPPAALPRCFPHLAASSPVVFLSSSSEGGLDTSVLIKNIGAAEASLEAF